MAFSYDPADYTPAAMVTAYNSTAAYDTDIYDISTALQEVQQDGALAGLDIIVTIHNQTAQNQLLPDLRVVNGWGAQNSPTPPTRFWLDDYSFAPKLLADSGGYQQSPNTRSIFYRSSWGPGAVNKGLQSACLAIDDGAGRLIGLSHDYLMQHTYECRFHRSKYGFRISTKGLGGAQPEAPNDWLEPGETRTIRLWLREVGGVTTAHALAAFQPYIAFVRATYPYVGGPRLNGRLFAFQCSDAGGNPPIGDVNNRYYVKFRNGVQYPHYSAPAEAKFPSEFDGWYHFLDHACPYAALQQNCYNGVMVRVLSGSDPLVAGNFFPSFWRNQPSNLRSTVAQIQQWERDRGLRVYVWAGRGFEAVQYGAWNSAVTFLPENAVDLLSEFDLVAAQRRAPSAEALAEIRRNIHECLRWCSGVGLDACPKPDREGAWIMDELASLRAEFPNKRIWIEGKGVDVCNSRGHYYYTNANFAGRSALADAIHPNYEAIVDHAGTSTWTFNQVESAGMVPLRRGSVEQTPWAGQSRNRRRRDTRSIHGSVTRPGLRINGE